MNQKQKPYNNYFLHDVIQQWDARRVGWMIMCLAMYQSFVSIFFYIHGLENGLKWNGGEPCRLPSELIAWARTRLWTWCTINSLYQALISPSHKARDSIVVIFSMQKAAIWCVQWPGPRTCGGEDEIGTHHPTPPHPQWPFPAGHLWGCWEDTVSSTHSYTHI